MVMAHEFCHLADFLISKTKGRPHGRSFWAWAQKCNDAFKERGIKITQDYEFAEGFQYIWMCSNPLCGVEIGRYSKSLDVEKVVCGQCGGKFVLTYPAPLMLRHSHD